MTSGKQRRIKLDARRQVRRKKQAAEEARVQRAKRERAAQSGALVDSSKHAPDGSYSVPEFVTRGYYQDKPFACKVCGKEETWTATQQKWWYEVAKGNVWTTARLCRTCRRRERDRRTEARRVHLEGLACKRQRRSS